MYETCLVNTVDNPTARWLLRTVISLEMVRVAELNAVMPLLRPCVIGAMRRSTKEANSRKSQGSRCGRLRTVRPLKNFLNADILPSTDSRK